jgi:hypothetical protein
LIGAVHKERLETFVWGGLTPLLTSYIDYLLFFHSNYKLFDLPPHPKDVLCEQLLKGSLPKRLSNPDLSKYLGAVHKGCQRGVKKKYERRKT